MKRQDPDYDEQFLPGGWQRFPVPNQSKQDAYLVRVQCYRGGQVRNSQTTVVNHSQVCVASGLAEYPLLVLALDIDPLFVVLNKVTVAMRAKADLIGAGIFMEPSQVERLKTCFISSQVSRKESKDLRFCDYQPQYCPHRKLSDRQPIGCRPK